MSDPLPPRRYDDPSPPADSTDALEPEDRNGISGDVGEPQARTGTWLLASLLAFVLLGIVLALVFLTSEPEERRPLPATPPTALEER